MTDDPKAFVQPAAGLAGAGAPDILVGATPLLSPAPELHRQIIDLLWRACVRRARALSTAPATFPGRSAGQGFIRGKATAAWSTIELVSQMHELRRRRHL